MSLKVISALKFKKKNLVQGKKIGFDLFQINSFCVYFVFIPLSLLCFPKRWFSRENTGKFSCLKGGTGLLE